MSEARFLLERQTHRALHGWKAEGKVEKERLCFGSHIASSYG